MKRIIYRTTTELPCQCDAEVIVCLASSLTVSGAPFINATLLNTTFTVSSCDTQIYQYLLEYDESQLVDPAYNILNSDITGIVCRDCLTDYVDFMALVSGSAIPNTCFVFNEVQFAAAIASPTCLHIVIAAQFTLTADRTVPVTKVLSYLRSAYTTTNSYTLTIESKCLFGTYRCFVLTSAADLVWHAGMKFQPEWVGAAGDGVSDDYWGIQLAIDVVVNSSLTVGALINDGTVELTSGKRYLVGNTVVIPTIARNFTFTGYGAFLVGAVNGPILQISDNGLTAGRAGDINILGITVAGLGENDPTYPAQDGIIIYSVLGLTLRDVMVRGVPGIGIRGIKPHVVGCKYWNVVLWDHVSVRWCGQALQIGAPGRLEIPDDLTCLNCIFNGCGQYATTIKTAAAWIAAYRLSMINCEISGNVPVDGVTATKGFSSGLKISEATGLLSGLLFEVNGNDINDSSDLYLDEYTHAIQLHSAAFYGASAQCPEWAILDKGLDNTLDGIVWTDSITHMYDYIVNVNYASSSRIGSISAASAPAGPASGIVARGGTAWFGKSTIDSHGDYVRTGRRIEQFETKYATDNPAQIAINANWGTTAEVQQVDAYDSHGDFVVNAKGANHVDGCTITVTFADGGWPDARVPTVIFYLRDSSIGVPPFTRMQVVPSTTGFVVTFTGAPTHDELYFFSYMVLGK